MALKFKTTDKNFTRNLVKKHKLVPHLDRFLGVDPEEFEFRYEPKVADSAWHPSGHCIPPPSVLYELAINTNYAPSGNPDGLKVKPQDIPTSLRKTFLVGHFWHQLLQYGITELGLAHESAIERKGKSVWGTIEDGSPKPFHWATGAADVAPCSIPGHGDYLIDFKTMGNHAYKGNSLPNGFAEKYEAQINIYMDWFQLEKGLIVCVQKDTPHDMKEFEFEYNGDLVGAIYDKWEFVSECLNAGTPPTETEDKIFDVEEYLKGPVAQ